jgi:hypothetical protein
MRHPFFWGFVLGAGGYWALQHFTGVGKTGARGSYGG